MENFKTIINSGKPVLVEFMAEWCGPCKTMGPILKEVKAKLGDSAIILKVDIDKNPDLANQLEIHSVPTLMLYKNGKVAWKQAGVVPAFELVKRLQEANHLS